MKKYSIVVFIKDRGPKERIQVFLKSWGERFIDSEILIIDSSNDRLYKKIIPQICEEFEKTRYIYLGQDGLMWSKTDAHNLGIEKADSRYTITTDIDAYPPPGLKDLVEPIVEKNKDRDLFISRYRFVKDIGFKPYFENDLKIIEAAVDLRQTPSRKSALGGLQLASSGWFKKHPYISRKRWGKMDVKFSRHHSALNLTRYTRGKIWIYHMFHPIYKRMSEEEFLKVRKEEENLLRAMRI